MSRPDDGGPAYPAGVVRVVNDCRSGYPWHDGAGMSLRDYFAAAALTGLLATPGCKDWQFEDFSINAFALADAFLAERAKGGAE